MTTTPPCPFCAGPCRHAFWCALAGWWGGVAVLPGVALALALAGVFALGFYAWVVVLFNVR